MTVIENNEIYSDAAGMKVRRKGTDAVFARATALPGDTADDFEEVDPAEVAQAVDEAAERAAYEAEVERLIRRRYTVSQELALLRQRESKPEEFAEYDAFAEQCKAEAKQLGIRS